MKSTAKPEPPESTDLAGWQEIVALGRLGEFPMETIIAAFLDLRPKSERTFSNCLARYISDDMMTRLRRKTGRNHRNEGNDITARAHFKLWQVLMTPGAADADGMRKAYASRVEFRLKDAIAEEERERRIPASDSPPRVSKSKSKKTETRPAVLVDIGEHPDLKDEDAPDETEFVGDVGIMRDDTLMNGVRNLDEQIDVDRILLQCVPDHKKRLAFYFYMDRVPFKSKRGQSIATALQIDESTARRWIEEVQATLKEQLGVSHDEQ